MSYRNESGTPVINGNGGESSSGTSIPASGVNEEIMNFHSLFFLEGQEGGRTARS